VTQAAYISGVASDSPAGRSSEWLDAFRLALALVCCAAGAAVIWLALAYRAPGPEISMASAGAFGGSTSIPVRPIQYDNAPASGDLLVHVPCAGRARRVSSCWVSGAGH
jgi:hypothetical protein